MVRFRAAAACSEPAAAMSGWYEPFLLDCPERWSWSLSVWNGHLGGDRVAGGRLPDPTDHCTVPSVTSSEQMVMTTYLPPYCSGAAGSPPTDVQCSGSSTRCGRTIWFDRRRDFLYRRSWRWDRAAMAMVATTTAPTRKNVIAVARINTTVTCMTYTSDGPVFSAGDAAKKQGKEKDTQTGKSAPLPGQGVLFSRT